MWGTAYNDVRISLSKKNYKKKKKKRGCSLIRACSLIRSNTVHHYKQWQCCFKTQQFTIDLSFILLPSDCVCHRLTFRPSWPWPTRTWRNSGLRRLGRGERCYWRSLVSDRDLASSDVRAWLVMEYVSLRCIGLHVAGYWYPENLYLSTLVLNYSVVDLYYTQ